MSAFGYEETFRPAPNSVCFCTVSRPSRHQIRVPAIDVRYEGGERTKNDTRENVSS